ncbi:MAG: DUF2239 family protein [Chloroflexota bacterium]
MSNTILQYTSFSGHRRIAAGSLATVALAVKQAIESDSSDTILTFDDATGRTIDIDTRGSEADVVARLMPSSADVQPVEPTVDAQANESRGRGRPKLGVVAREVTLLPRHWEWLASQPGGASVALRKLVEEARKTHANKDRSRQAQERTYRFMSAIDGNLPNFEEASRALFANDQSRFSEQVAVWPDDVRAYAITLAFGDDNSVSP